MFSTLALCITASHEGLEPKEGSGLVMSGRWIQAYIHVYSLYTYNIYIYIYTYCIKDQDRSNWSSDIVISKTKRDWGGSPQSLQGAVTQQNISCMQEFALSWSRHVQRGLQQVGWKA